MSGGRASRRLLEVLAWAVASAAAGAATGLAVGVVGQGGFDPKILLISAVFGDVVGFTVLASIHMLGPRLRGLAPAARWGLLALSLLSGSAAATALVLYLFPLFVLRDLRQAFAVVSVNSVLALVLGAVVHVYEGLRWRLAESLREVEEVRLVEARWKEQAARAELAALQARIHPHFLFNTLNTISSLVTEDPERAEEVAQTLADLFRYTFKAAEAGRLVPLGEELDFVRGYLDIERARFGERLEVVWEVDPEARSVAVPGLLLQPLVENAVGHGIAPRSRGGTLRIRARLEGERLRVEVEDDGPGLTPGRAALLEGHGLENVKRRIETAYAGVGTFEIEAGPGGRGTLARLVIPVAPPGPLRALEAAAGKAEAGS